MTDQVDVEFAELCVGVERETVRALADAQLRLEDLHERETVRALADAQLRLEDLHREQGNVERPSFPRWLLRIHYQGYENPTTVMIPSDDPKPPRAVRTDDRGKLIGVQGSDGRWTSASRDCSGSVLYACWSSDPQKRCAVYVPVAATPAGILNS